MRVPLNFFLALALSRCLFSLKQVFDIRFEVSGGNKLLASRPGFRFIVD